jgi:hypothetical protein
MASTHLMMTSPSHKGDMTVQNNNSTLIVVVAVIVGLALAACGLVHAFTGSQSVSTAHTVYNAQLDQVMDDLAHQK